MERSIGITRVYRISDYNSLHLSDIISGIDGEPSLSPEVVGKLRFLQYIETERAYYKYLQLSEQLKSIPTDQVLETLSQARTTTFTELKELLIKGE